MKKTMKHAVSLILAAAMAFSLAACGQSGSETAAAEETSAGAGTTAAAAEAARRF